ncbi:hypothetical protein [Polaromonas sp.]|jgi:hypothetical protein|uniref:hypothetical protein n=1 Tax=Polaromonas sp. TaxID=1869339 RepID=UPI002D1FA206|nr:hypothetical protein [Polaromonas sp.]
MARASDQTDARVFPLESLSFSKPVCITVGASAPEGAGKGHLGSLACTPERQRPLVCQGLQNDPHGRAVAASTGSAAFILSGETKPGVPKAPALSWKICMLRVAFYGISLCHRLQAQVHLPETFSDARAAGVLNVYLVF